MTITLRTAVLLALVLLFQHLHSVSQAETSPAPQAEGPRRATSRVSLKVFPNGRTISRLLFAALLGDLAWHGWLHAYRSEQFAHLVTAKLQSIKYASACLALAIGVTGIFSKTRSDKKGSLTPTGWFYLALLTLSSLVNVSIEHLKNSLDAAITTKREQNELLRTSETLKQAREVQSKLGEQGEVVSEVAEQLRRTRQDIEAVSASQQAALEALRHAVSVVEFVGESTLPMPDTFLIRVEAEAPGTCPDDSLASPIGGDWRQVRRPREYLAACGFDPGNTMRLLRRTAVLEVADRARWSLTNDPLRENEVPTNALAATTSEAGVFVGPNRRRLLVALRMVGTRKIDANVRGRQDLVGWVMKLHSPDMADRASIESIVAFMPTGEQGELALAECWKDCQIKLTETAMAIRKPATTVPWEGATGRDQTGARVASTQREH